MTRIYLDHAAATPLHPQVLEAMLPYYSAHFGNPSSLHSYGRETKLALHGAHDQMAEILGCAPSRLVFTSGGTESDNMAIFGLARANAGKKRHLITSQVEHHAVLHACEQLEQFGYEVTYVPVDSQGMVHIEDIQQAVREDTFLISIMYANNEVGTIQPIEDIGRLARERGIAFHVDGVQALGMLPIQLSELPVDMMSFSAHKINGPKGCGVLYMSSGIQMLPHIVGGSQERKRRAGTENVPAIVGMAEALRITAGSLTDRRAAAVQLRATMLRILRDELGPEGFVVNGHPEQGLPHILNVSFPGLNTETLLMNLDLEGIAAASGSACTSGSLETSHVLRAMGLPENCLQSAVRFSFGYGNVTEQIEIAAKKTATIVARLRNRTYYHVPEVRMAIRRGRRQHR